MTSRERALLALAIVGFLVPNTMVIVYVIEHGVDVRGYVEHWWESLPAAQPAVDLIIAFVAFALWSAWEGRRLGMRTGWLAVNGPAAHAGPTPRRRATRAQES
jgi:hypothetical protein